MKWTPVDSHGLDVVLKPLAIGRDVDAFIKLQDSSCGSVRTANCKPDYRTPDTNRQSESLKARFFPTREPIGSWNKAALHIVWTCHDRSSRQTISECP